MACGCKNKGASQPTTQTQSGQSQPQPKQQPNNPTIQESIKKVVEKYYKK